MQLVRGLHNVQSQHHGCVLTIGKFDGVHLGHQAVLERLREKAKDLALPSAVMVFEPQPEEVFSPQSAPARLSPFRDKYNQLAELGIDRLICARFNSAFANMSAQAFIHQLLSMRLGVKFLVVGDDFRFGYQRSGDFSMLQAESTRAGFSVVSTDSFKLAEWRISSTLVREALAQNDFTRAKTLLGRPFSISGKVIHGEKKGRTIGFPTANLLLKRCKSPVQGVFAVNVVWRGQRYPAVANIGSKPTVQGTKALLEAHIFNFAQSLYGENIQVELLEKIRDEQRFNDFLALQQQIKLDCSVAKQILMQQ